MTPRARSATAAGAPDVIAPEAAGTLAGLLRERARRSPEAPAYRHFDRGAGAWRTLTWAEAAREAGRWQAALAREGLEPGERVAIMCRNRPEWMLFDMAAQALGLVVVPLYAEDRSGSAAWIIEHSGARLLLVEEAAQWTRLAAARERLRGLKRIVTLEPVAREDPRVRWIGRWLDGADGPFEPAALDPHTLATIVYTSGTTGRPKGVMLSHHNILWNAAASLRAVPALPDDLFLSFLPLSHTFERTVGYYLPVMAGSCVAYARSIPELAEDLASVRPTVLVTVPRIFERVRRRLEEQLRARPALARHLFHTAAEVGWAHFQHAQHRRGWSPALAAWPALHLLVAARVLERLGGRLRAAICGGAPLAPELGHLFIGLGVPILQGYGLTEHSPVISVNRAEDNVPESVGEPLPGVEVRIGPREELLVRSPSVMLGYWEDPDATRRMIDRDGWLHTGDQARIERGHVFITGRLKDVIVLATGEKVPPADMEMAILEDALFEQVMVVGEQRPYLVAVCVLDSGAWRALAAALGLDPDDPASLADPRAERAVVERIGRCLHAFPGYAQVRRAVLTLEPWTVEDGLLTPTLKPKRRRIEARHAEAIAACYAGH